MHALASLYLISVSCFKNIFQNISLVGCILEGLKSIYMKFMHYSTLSQKINLLDVIGWPLPYIKMTFIVRELDS